MASLLNDPAAALETVKEWVLTTKTGKAAAAYAGSFVLAKASDSLSFPYRFMSLLIGTPLLAVYVPLRVAFNRLIYPRAPNIPNAPASFEGATRLTQGLFGFLPEGSATLIPSSVFESLAWALHPGAEKLWKKVDGPKDGLPEGVKGAWIQDPALKKGDEDLVVFWSHGGGYCVYSPSEFANFCMCLYYSMAAKGKKIRIFSLDYDLAPAGRFPRQLEQATAAYDYLLKSGFPAEKIAFGGDSAGANLALVLSLHLSIGAPGLPKPTLPKPGKLALISPWTRLYSTTEPIAATHSMVTRDGGDYIASGLVKYWAERYAGPNSLSDPWISPALFPEDVLRAALPKQTLVTAGTHEIIVDDIDVLVKKLGDKGVSYVKGQDRVHDYVTLDVTFGLGSFDKAGREIGVEQLAKFLAA